jgi:hypothetical protein
MRDVLPALDHVAPGRLTEVLWDQGYLQDECVMAVHLQKPWPTALSMVAHLESQYTAHALASLPSQLFLKTSRPDCLVDFPLQGQKEAAFYTRIAATMPVPLVVCRYGAVYAPEAKKFHLVLEDVSASHLQATVWPLPPVESQCVQAIKCLAQLHAHWWDHTSLAQDMGARPTEIFIQRSFHMDGGS